MRFLDWLFRRRVKKETPPEVIIFGSNPKDDGPLLCEVTVHTTLVFPTRVIIHAHDTADAYEKVNRLIQAQRIRPKPRGKGWTEYSVYSSQVYLEE